MTPLRQRLLRGLWGVIGPPLRWLGIKFVVAPVHMLGHLVLEPDLWIKQRHMAGERYRRDVLLAPSDVVANACIADAWGRHLRVIRSPLLCRALNSLAVHADVVADTAGYFRNVDATAMTIGPSTFPPVVCAWGTRPPLLALSSDQQARGRDQLRRLGLPEDAWFVCVQNRTPGFYAPLYESEGAGLNDQDFRDCAIANFIPAISEIVSAGGWCIRVGDSFTEPLAPMEGVIDYAHSNIKSDWMDVFLCASCRFFVGNTSGLNTIPTAFGVPVIRTNVIPMSALVKLCKGDLGIPKLVHRGGETLPFADVLGSDLGSYYVSSAFRDAGVTHAENSPEDVCDLVVEMLEALDGRASYDEHDRALQAAFRRLVQPHHFCHGSTSRIGRDFLRRHAHLL